jgi:tRNA dimethylallyltransferase
MECRSGGMVYAHDSKSCTERFEGSSPSSGTMQKEKVIVILGPTSSGKTALSIELAQKFGGEIVSADSRQVYRGMNLGTGKATKKEMAGVRHHLLDVADPKNVFSVAEYKAAAVVAIANIVSRKKIPIICGGTGFYIDTLTKGIILPEVPPNPKLRAKLEGQDAPTLFMMLGKLDPTRAKTIDKNNPVRLVRAIEIATALGTVPKLTQKPPYEILQIGLDMPDETLKSRISLRLKARIKSGMMREATKLHANGITWRRMRDLGLEYRAMADLLTGKIDKEEFESNLANDIWQYAKRQRTWWKRDKTIVWLNPLKKSDVKKAHSLVKKFL